MAGPADAPGPLPSLRVAVLVALVGLVAFSWPALPSFGTALLGHPFGEVDNHLWMSAFGDRPDAPSRNLPLGFDLPLLDPVHLPGWTLGAALGPVAAYDLVILLDLALAALGGWALAREVGACRGGALVGMVATAFSPFLAGMIEFGITESWPVGWLALHAALLLRFGRTGAARDALGAGAALGAFLLSGWYHAAFALVAELGLAAWAFARGPRARTVAGIVLQGALAALPLVPLWSATRARAGIWAPRLSPLTRPDTYADWTSNPRFGVDLLNFVLPRAGALDISRTVYVGLAVALLAVAAVAARAPSRRPALAALLVATPLWVLALGHWLRVGGVPVLALGPLPAGRLVDALPVARGISHWYRAAGPATVFLAAAAALGASTVLARVAPAWRTRAAVLLAALALADGIALSPVPWPRITYAPDPPSALLDLPRAGGLLQLPFDEGRGLPGTASRRIYDQWQVFHRRPIAEHYEGIDALLHINALAAGFQQSCAGVAPRPRSAGTPADDLARLRDAGVAYIVVHPPYAKPGCARLVGLRLGEPVVRTARAVVWDVEHALATLRAATDPAPRRR